MNWFRDHIDPKYLKICAYASITTLATIAVGLLIYHSGGLLITGRDLIGAVATPIVYGMLLCYILLPLVRGITDWLARRNIFKDNFSARLHIGVFITVALVLLLVSAIICLLVVVITRSAENINMETLQALWSSAEGDITATMLKRFCICLKGSCWKSAFIATLQSLRNTSISCC